QLDVPLKGFQTVVAPEVIPTNIPTVNLTEHFDPKDYSGTGVEGGLATGMVPSGNDVFMESIVEEKPSILSGPQLVYPDLLRQAGIQGRVIVQVIVDTTGRAEPNSVKVLQSPNPGFDQPAKNYVLKSLYRPARVHGRAVRVLVNQPLGLMVTVYASNCLRSKARPLMSLSLYDLWLSMGPFAKPIVVVMAVMSVMSWTA